MMTDSHSKREIEQTEFKFSGLIEREPEIATVGRGADGKPSRVLNFDVATITIDGSGAARTNYVKCSAWGEDSIEKFYPEVGRAWEHHLKIEIVGAVFPAYYQHKTGALKIQPILKCKVARAFIVPPAEARSSNRAVGPSKERAQQQAEPQVAASRKTVSVSLDGKAKSGSGQKSGVKPKAVAKPKAGAKAKVSGGARKGK